MSKKVIHNNLNLRSEEVQEILTNPPMWIIRWGITLIFLFALIITVLSFIIKYPDFVNAKIIVTTQRPPEKILARNSGPLEHIFVVDRDTVSQNQKLAVIKNMADTEDVYTLKRIVDTLDFTKGNYQFPVELTADLNLGNLQSAYFNFEKNYVDYFLLEEIQSATKGIDYNQWSLAEIRIRLVVQIRHKQMLEAEINLARTDIQKYNKLSNNGDISQQKLNSKNKKLLELENKLGEITIAISQLQKIATSTNLNLSDANPEPLVQGARLSKDLKLSYTNLKKALRDWEYKYILTSPIDGVVSFQELWYNYQYVQENQLIYIIMPLDKSKLVGKLVLPAQNAGKVTIGQKVLVKLDNYPYQEYGMLVGRVENISVSPDTEGNYFVYISLPKGTKTSYGKDLGFDQELLGNAEIITEDLSVAGRIFYKFKDIFKY